MSNQDWLDLAAGWGKKAINKLFVINPGRTSLGILFGVIIQMAVEIFAPLLARQQLMDFSRITLPDFICLGIFIFNLPLALCHRRMNPQIKIAIAAIKKAKSEGYVSVAQARLRYLNLIDRMIAQIEGWK
jgi:hypothetical protein